MENVSYDLLIADGTASEFNFKTSFDPESISANTDNLKLVGKANVVGSEQVVSFETPIDNLEFSFVLAGSEDAEKFKTKDTLLKINPANIKVEGSDSGAIKDWIAKEVQASAISLQQKAIAGEVDTLTKLPVTMMIPMGATYLAGVGARKIQITDNFIEFGFTPESFGKIVNPRVFGRLKKIKTQFDEEDENTPGLQMIIDENFFNMFVRQIGI